MDILRGGLAFSKTAGVAAHRNKWMAQSHVINSTLLRACVGWTMDGPFFLDKFYGVTRQVM